MLIKYAQKYVCPECKGSLFLTIISKNDNYIKAGEFHCSKSNNFVRFFIEPFRKYFTRKLPLLCVLGLSYVLGAIFQLLAQWFHKPLNKINMTWLPLNDYIIYRTNYDNKINTQMIFDQLLAPTFYLFSKQEIEQMFTRQNISLTILRHHNSNLTSDW